MSLLHHFQNGLADLLFPRNCLLCRQYLQDSPATAAICRPCRVQIKPIPEPHCPRCSRPGNRGQLECVECHAAQYDFDQALCAVAYNDCLRQLLHRFKYGQKTLLAPLFQSLISSKLQENPEFLLGIHWIIPIPLHASRFRERGYNQAEILARGIGAFLNIPVENKLLIRQKPTQNQAVIGRIDRWTNMRGAFRINHSFDLKEKSLLIVDDLLTTGTTASEAARVLKRGGAKKVKILTLAAAI